MKQKIVDVKTAIEKKRSAFISFQNTKKLIFSASPDQLPKFILATFFIDAIMLELSIKLFFEIEHKEQCERTHNIWKIFKNLESKTQDWMKEEYGKDESKIKEKMGDRSILEHSLEDVLRGNADKIVGLKYDPQLNNKTASFNGPFIEILIKEIDNRLKNF